jgi:GTP-binding protein HflX
MTGSPRPLAIVLGVQLDGVSDAEHTSSLDELTRLAQTLGLEISHRISQKRPALSKAAVVGEGKLKEIAELTGGSGVIPSGAPARKGKAKDDEDGAEDELAATDKDDESEDPPGFAERQQGEPRPGKPTLILIDHDLSPSQARNLERATSAEVMDRTAVILAIFQRHARSREARLEVEIARLAYLAPRLREVGGGGDRQRGGIGGRGAGESSLELDRRKVRDRIAELRRELASIEQEARTRRRRRAEQSTAALVGYTNAGKSSLMRALTGSEVLVADALFATLDTTVRALQPETVPRILITDTVGFIKKLPHDLVASFRSTLDEAREAGLLLHIVDASDPAFGAQIEVTRAVLDEIGADAPRIIILNKADRLSADQRAELAREHPEAVLMSAMRPDDVAALRARIIAFFEKDMIEEELVIPFDAQHRVAQAHAACRVLSETYDGEGARLRVRGRPETLARLRSG